MTHDLIIRNGTIVDGSGDEVFEGDIAIDGDQISAIGEVSGEGREEIDAKGYLVTPGFVDIHTHLDAQIGWDPMLSPISWHGVTTALLGNCGVTFAPCKPTDRELLAGMMETVEDIPREAIMSGLPWSWESYGGYLDAVESLRPAINVAGLVGHCAVRFYVMGERAVDEQPTDEEKQMMAEVVRQSLKDGAVGFSTSRFPAHYLPDGRHVPGTHAQHDELEEIARAVGEENGLMQNVLNMGEDFEGELDLLRKEARASGNRVLFSTGAGPTDDWGDRVASSVSAMREEGLDVNAVSIPRGSGFVSGLQSNLLWNGPTWKTLAAKGFDERLQAIQDDVFVEQLIEEAGQKTMRFPPDQIFYLGEGESPNYAAGEEASLHRLCQERGEEPARTYLNLARETGGKALFTIRMFNRNMDSLAKVISSDYCLPGLGDAGAHVSQIMDCGWATFVLSHWYREAGLYTLEEAVRRITSAPARIMGIKDRGLLKAGMKADINIVDIDNLAERMPEIVHDFPGGAPRFIQKARGYKATVCNGQVILRDDEYTGNRGGAVLRNTA